MSAIDPKRTLAIRWFRLRGTKSVQLASSLRMGKDYEVSAKSGHPA